MHTVSESQVIEFETQKLLIITETFEWVGESVLDFSSLNIAMTEYYKAWVLQTSLQQCFDFITEMPDANNNSMVQIAIP